MRECWTFADMRQITLFNDLILTARADVEEAHELFLRLQERGTVIGTDEAGRGALAGPVVAAAVCLTSEQEDELARIGLRDSKRLAPGKREKIFKAMNELGVLWRAYHADIPRIEHDNILQASLWAMGRCVSNLAGQLDDKPACVIVDGTERIPGLDFPQWPLIQADNLVLVVSAASVIAKVIRDRLMKRLDAIYPGYGLGQNKGYPTRSHIEKVIMSGMSDIHRPSFCRKILQRCEVNINAVN